MSAARLAELPRWIDELSPAEPLLTAAAFDPRQDRLTEAVEVRKQLPAATVPALLTSVPAAFHCGLQDILLTALGLAVTQWCRERQPGSTGGVLVDVEGHGREDVVAGADLSRTLGWFTAIRPVRLDLGHVSPAEVSSGGDRLGRAVIQVKEQLSAVPDNGLGYGLLRYLVPGCREVLGRLPGAQIGFNYLGRFSAAGDLVAGEPRWGLAPDPLMTTTVDPDMPMAHGLELHVVVHDLADGPRLTATWTGASRLWRREDLEDLDARWSAALQGIAVHAAQPEAGGHSPSDFPLAVLTQTDIEDIEAAW